MTKKLKEAMRAVWESDKEWFTKQNALQSIAMLGIAGVSLWPWVVVVLTFAWGASPDSALHFLMFISCCALATVWSLFWLRVFSKWWPF